MFDRDPTSLIVQAARLYHESRLTQPEIAKRLKVSQSRVSRWLAEAERVGIVRTIVVAPEGTHPDLEDRVCERYGLSQVVVVEAADDAQSVEFALGGAAARYLETTLEDGARMGISSYSATLMATVEAMVPLRKRKVDQVVQVMGGNGRPDVQVQATRLADRLARLTGADPTFLPTPGIVASASTRDALLRDPLVQNVAGAWDRLTDLVLGIGSLAPSPLLAHSGNSASEAEMQQLREAGAVGDVAMRYFDCFGQPVESELDDRVVGISASALRGVPRRIGVAGGLRKSEAIKGAILGGWINVLITDHATALYLTDQADEQRPV